MEMDLTCTICSSDYTDSNLPRLLQCGHTFCHSCLSSLLQSQEEKQVLICPDDHQSMILSSTLEQLPKNFALMKIIESRKKNSSNNSSGSLKDASFDVSKINKEQQVQEDEVAQELISEINRASVGKQEDLLKNSQENTIETYNNSKNSKQESKQTSEKEEVELCLLHQRPIEVVCMNDYERLCSKCALFGQHKVHEFKSIQEIERQNSKHYQQIIAMFEDKATFMEKVAKKTVEKELLQTLSAQVAGLKGQIKDKFKKIAEELAKAEKNFTKKLEETSKKIEKKLLISLQLDKATSDFYDNWEAKTLEAIKDSQKPSSNGHLSFYLKRNEIVNEGKNLLIQLQKMQQKGQTEAIQIIEDFGIAFNDAPWQNAINSLVQLIQHKQQPSKKNEDVKLKQNQGTLANCEFGEIKKVPQLNRHESEESLLDACDFQTHSFIGQTFGSKMLDQSFVSVKQDHNQSHHSKQPTSRPLAKRKITALKQQKKVPAKQGPIVGVGSIAKKKIKNLKIPQKFEKIVEGIMSDSVQLVDLTNAELGDATILHILELMRQNTKVKTVKLIRNKLTDEGVIKMLPYLCNIQSLNLSQNQLTENVLNLIIENRGSLPLLKSLVLSQTKIVERKSKGTIDRLKKLDVAVSV